MEVRLRRGRPVVRWKDRMKEYMHERGGDRGGGIVGIGRGGSYSAVAITLRKQRVRNYSN